MAKKTISPDAKPKIVKVGNSAVLITSQGIYNLADLVCVCPFHIWYKHNSPGYIIRFRQSSDFIEISKEHYEALVTEALEVDIDLTKSK